MPGWWPVAEGNVAVVAQGDETDPPGDHDEQADGGDAVIALWREPVFNLKLRQVPAFLLPRLTEMAAEVTDARLARHIYYERIHCLLAVAGQASRPDPTTFRLAEPPSDAERRLGAVIGQAFIRGARSQMWPSPPGFRPATSWPSASGPSAAPSGSAAYRHCPQTCRPEISDGRPRNVELIRPMAAAGTTRGV